MRREGIVPAATPLQIAGRNDAALPERIGTGHDRTTNTVTTAVASEPR